MKHIKLFEGFINESSYTDFLSSYDSEIYEAINKLALISSHVKHTMRGEEPLGIDSETYDKIEDKLSVYDTNVVKQIEHWISLGRTSVDEIGKFAVENMNRYGTEPRMVLFAIDDYFDIVNRKYDLIEEGLDNESESVDHVEDILKIVEDAFDNQISTLDWEEYQLEEKRFFLKDVANKLKEDGYKIIKK